MASSVYAAKPWLKLYADHVPEALPEPEKSMVDLFEESAKRVPNTDAVRYFEERISYRELDDLASRFARVLADRGVEKGDRLAVYTQNNPQFLVATYGAWKRGAAVVPLNPMFKAREVDYHLNDSGAKVLVCLESLYGSVAREVVPATAVEHVFTTSELDFLPEGYERPNLAASRRTGPGEGAEDLLEAIRSSPEPDGSEKVDTGPEDTALIVYTSGTTGRPKGAVSLHRNVAYNAETYRTWTSLDDEDSVLGVAPLFHITGLVGHVAVAGLAGIPLVLYHRPDPQETLRLIELWQPTFTVGAITVFLSLMNAPGARYDALASMTKVYSGGAPIAPSITEQFERKFDVYIHNIYGLTESNSPTHAVPLDARAPVDGNSGALSVGVPVPGCEARLVSLEDPSEPVPVGESGEFAAKGPMIFSHYWEKPEATEAAFHDGFFLTGDVAVMDEQGYFYIVDRKKDMINVSGYKVWPREVEDTLYTHPAVREAAVIGVPDSYRGETVKAFVALKEGSVATEDDIIAHCKENLAAYKYPRSVEFLDEVPKTATGKFLRRELRTGARG
ncbi:Acyl-CoA synthetases (AMP-forming)/AMP-acid ligases II [Rubrobacter radiotolerans]|uniref:AMP-binding protein n=1 Tax=Rubrobacter radiotolerans TaxID=42256 RepID=A0A023X564_RUBRA|nr:AMP-binding protein [Rubrobacter radiotolerans]AHY47366.1 Acyl-CoA synthetases (AMP-forming)/AMP-acid ligases II [Rubrobacter radiotolerans]MDX5894770.1 AMP-binding protein [Rubrobacter radiotolerans]SMC06733.1 long-chain acyl-CoA synthetase [Rubrobacter radiotolerans DSM 5868]